MLDKLTSCAQLGNWGLYVVQEGEVALAIYGSTKRNNIRVADIPLTSHSLLMEGVLREERRPGCRWRSGGRELGGLAAGVDQPQTLILQHAVTATGAAWISVWSFENQRRRLVGRFGVLARHNADREFGRRGIVRAIEATVAAGQPLNPLLALLINLLRARSIIVAIRVPASKGYTSDGARLRRLE